MGDCAVDRTPGGGRLVEEQDVLEAARALRPRLPELVGEDAARVDAELERLLALADTGQPVKLELLSLFAERDPTRRWAHERLEPSSRLRGLDPPGGSSYARLPGDPQLSAQPLAAPALPARPRYACPTCGWGPWRRFSAADQIPNCPDDGARLVETPRPSG
jgi:hypothetical protein